MLSLGRQLFLPANWPALHHKCDNWKCTFANLPTPSAGTYSCGNPRCAGIYKVSPYTAAKVDARTRQPFPLYDFDNNLKPRGTDAICAHRVNEHAHAQAQRSPVPLRAYRVNDVKSGATVPPDEVPVVSGLAKSPLTRTQRVKKSQSGGGGGSRESPKAYGTSAYSHGRGGSPCDGPPLASSRQYYPSTREVHSNAVAVAATGRSNGYYKHEYTVRNH